MAFKSNRKGFENLHDECKKCYNRRVFQPLMGGNHVYDCRKPVHNGIVNYVWKDKHKTPCFNFESIFKSIEEEYGS